MADDAASIVPDCWAIWGTTENVDGNTSTLYDWSANGRDLTVNDAEIFPHAEDAAWGDRQVFRSNGVTAGVALPTTLSLDTDVGFAIGLWLNVQDNYDAKRHLFGLDGDSFTNGLGLTSTAGYKWYIETNTNGDFIRSTSQGPPYVVNVNSTSGNYEHWLIDAPGDGTIQIYQDGVQVATGTPADNTISFDEMFLCDGASSFNCLFRELFVLNTRGTTSGERTWLADPTNSLTEFDPNGLSADAQIVHNNQSEIELTGAHSDFSALTVSFNGTDYTDADSELADDGDGTWTLTVTPPSTVGEFELAANEGGADSTATITVLTEAMFYTPRDAIIWVDADFGGSPDGSHDNPYNDADVALGAVAADDTLLIVKGSVEMSANVSISNTIAVHAWDSTGEIQTKGYSITLGADSAFNCKVTSDTAQGTGALLINSATFSLWVNSEVEVTSGTDDNGITANGFLHFQGTMTDCRLQAASGSDVSISGATLSYTATGNNIFGQLNITSTANSVRVVDTTFVGGIANWYAVSDQSGTGTTFHKCTFYSTSKTNTVAITSNTNGTDFSNCYFEGLTSGAVHTVADKVWGHVCTNAFYDVTNVPTSFAQRVARGYLTNGIRNSHKSLLQSPVTGDYGSKDVRFGSNPKQRSYLNTRVRLLGAGA